MTNKKILILIYFLLSLCIAHPGTSQIISNRLDFQLILNTAGNLHGNDLVKEKQFVHPSFYPGFDKIHGVSAEIYLGISKYLSLGAAFSSIRSEEWANSESSEYDRSEFTMKEFGPVFKIHSPLQPNGLFNHLRIFLDIEPNAGSSKISLGNPVETVDGPEGIIGPRKSSDFFYGIKGTIGAEWSLAQAIGLRIGYSLKKGWIRPTLYADNHYVYSGLNMGVIFRFKANKRFLYE